MVEVDDSEVVQETEKRKQEFDSMLAKAQEVNREVEGGLYDVDGMILLLGTKRRREAQPGRSR